MTDQHNELISKQIKAQLTRKRRDLKKTVVM